MDKEVVKCAAESIRKYAPKYLSPRKLAIAMARAINISDEAVLEMLRNNRIPKELSNDEEEET